MSASLKTFDSPNAVLGERARADTRVLRVAREREVEELHERRARRFVHERVDGRDRVGEDDDVDGVRDALGEDVEVADDGSELQHRDRDLERADDVCWHQRHAPGVAVHVARDAGRRGAVLCRVGAHLVDRGRVDRGREANCDEARHTGPCGENDDPPGGLLAPWLRRRRGVCGP